MKNANCWFQGLFTYLLLYVSVKKFVVVHATEEQTVTINTAKWTQIVSDRFLSITIDPETILLGKDNFSDTTKILKLARGLAPSYFRVGGPSTDKYHFDSLLSRDDALNNKTITESQWVTFNNFAREAGFDVIVCLSALQRLNGIWDPRNALDLISFSDKMGYKINWQLGYELQKFDGKISAEKLAVDVNRLRNILNSFSHYKHSIIVGPDITNLYTKKDIGFLRNFIQEAGSSLDAITWHPKYLSTGSFLATGEELNYMLERLIFEKEGLIKMFGRQIARKPIWIAESNNNTNCEYFIHAMNWAQELGSFAGIGIQTVMKQPNLKELFEITPSYWVSLLHKALVGEVVLDVRHNSANNTNIAVFCHCTNTMKNNKASELITTEYKYEPGAITFFAVNRRSSEVNLSVKLSPFMKQDNIELHQYLLTADHTVSDPLLSRNVLLNGKLLALQHSGNLPDLSPNIEHTGWNFTVSLPPVSVGFWVLPRAGVKLCVSASKKMPTHKIDVQSQPLIKSMSIGTYVGSYAHKNSEIFGSDLKHNDNAHVSKNEINKGYNLDDSKHKTFKNKKFYSLKNKKILEKKTQQFKNLATTDENKTETLQPSKHKEAFIDKGSGKPSKIIREELGLEAHDNYTGNISTEQKALGRLKRYAPENNNAMPFSGFPLDMFQQSSLSGRTTKTRRKKKAELKADKKDDRELRKDKLKQKDDNIQASLFDPFFSSIENEEQYFHNMKREDNEIRPFPSGDIYLKQGNSFEEQRNNDYDYVDRDEKEFKEDEDEVDDMETIELDLNLKPGEFFETIHGTRDKINENFVGYGGELWEAETFTMTTPTEKMEDVMNDEDGYDQEVIHESSPTEEEDRKRKAAAAQLLNSYLTEGYAENQSEESKHKDKTSRKTRIQRKTERKQEYAQDTDDDSIYFIADHKDKTKNILEKPTHHHHHHHHITGHSKPIKEGKQNHYDHAHNIHNYKDKTRKLTNQNEKHSLSEEDDIFFPHINHEKGRDNRKNHAYHRSLHSSEENIELMKASHRGREKAAQGNKIKNDALLLNNEHFESSSISTKSSRQSRARKISHRGEETDSTNTKSKSDSKTSEYENDNNISKIYEENSESKKLTQQNDKQERKKINKPSISARSNDYSHQEKDVHSEKKKSKDKQKYSNYGHNTKYETRDMISEEVDSRSTESDAKLSKKRVHIMDASDTFEDDESQMNSGELIEDENYEHKLDPNSAEYTDKRTISIGSTKSNYKVTARSSSENFEDVKAKSYKQKEKNSNHRTESMKINSSVVSANNSEKVGHRKPKRTENISDDTIINDHISRKSVSSRKSSQSNDYSNEEITEIPQIVGKSSIKTQDSKHKHEKGNKNKRQSQEMYLEQENDNTDGTEENSLEHNNRMEAIPEDAHENLNAASLRLEAESKNEPLSDEDPSNEDISDKYNHNTHSQQKSLNVSKSKYKTKAKHISDEYILEDNISDIQSEPKKRHTSSEHYIEENKEFESNSEVGKLEGESKHSGEADSMREKSRVPNDENNEKPFKEKESKRKNGKHRTTKKSDHHNRARRETFAFLTNNNSDTALNYSYSSENSNKEMSHSNEIELLPGTDLNFKQNEMQHLIDSANRFIGNIVADDNSIKLEPDMLLVPQQYVENEDYSLQDVLGQTSYRDTVLENISPENTHGSKTIEYNSEDHNFSNSGTESQIRTWTFRNDNSIEILNEQSAEPLIRENNAKREVDGKLFENVILSVMKTEESDKEKIVHESLPYQEKMNINHDKESSFIIKGNEEDNRHALFHSPVDIHEIPNISDVNKKIYTQDNHFSKSSRNEEGPSYELSLKVTDYTPIKASDSISDENGFQTLLEKKSNEELSKEEVLYSNEKSNEMEQLALESKPGVNQYVEKNKFEDISMKSVAAPEYADNLSVYFATTEPTNSLYSEIQQNSENLIKMFDARTEKEVLQAEKTSEEDEHSNKDIENNEHIESKYNPNVAENIQFERVPKAVMYIIENTSDMNKMEANNYEGKHMLNPADETRNGENGLESISGFENSQMHSILQNASKELTRNIEVLDGVTPTVYDQERSFQDNNNGEPVSLSSLSPNLDNNGAPTTVSLVSINEEDRSNEPSIMSTNISKEIAPSERSSSVNDVKKTKIIKTSALPKKNVDKLKLEQKYKERIQQLKERRAKIKAGILKKTDSIQFKKFDNVSTNKKIRKRRAIDKENVQHASSLQKIINHEDLSNQLNANTFDSSSDSQDEKSFFDSVPMWVTKDYDTDDSSGEQLYNFKLIQKAQHATPNTWNTDIFVTPSHIVTESIGIFDHYTSRDIEQRSTESSDTISVPVTFHKTLLITENNPYYSDEEAARDEDEKDKANNEFLSEKVLVKLTAPLVNYEPLNDLQQGTTYFHKIIPVHENDIDVLQGMYSNDFELGNTETKEKLDLDRTLRYVSSAIEGDTSFRNNYQSFSFAEPTNVKGYSNYNILKDPHHESEKNKIKFLPGELHTFPDNLKDALANDETDYNRLIEDTSSKTGRDTRKETMFASGANGIVSSLLFPTLEVITDAQNEDNYDVFINQDLNLEDQAVLAVRSKRALRTDYDPLNDDLLWPFIIPIIPDNEKSIDIFLSKKDSQKFKEINNNMDPLQAIGSENDMNKHQMMNINEKGLTHQNILSKLLSPRNVNYKTFGSNYMNQVGITPENIDKANVNADLLKEKLDAFHPNSLDFHILDFGEKEASYTSKSNELNVIVSDEAFNEIESKLFYKNTHLETNEQIISDNSKEEIKYLYPKLQNYSPVETIIEEYVHKTKLSPNSTSVDEDSYSLLKDKKISENNNSSEYGGEVNSKEIIDMRTSLWNGSHFKQYANPKEEFSVMLNVYLGNTTNNALNNRSTSNVEASHGNNHSEVTLYPKEEDAATTERNSLVQNKPTKASTKGKHENLKTATDSQPSSLHSILKTLTETVIGLISQLSPWKTSAN